MQHRIDLVIKCASFHWIEQNKRLLLGAPRDDGDEQEDGVERHPATPQPVDDRHAGEKARHASLVTGYHEIGDSISHSTDEEDYLPAVVQDLLRRPLKIKNRCGMIGDVGDRIEEEDQSVDVFLQDGV